MDRRARACEGELGPVERHRHRPALRAPHPVPRPRPKRSGWACCSAHPDLAGKLAAAKRLTEASTAEQASAGLDALTDDEREQFTHLNGAYSQKFGFPFIIAVKRQHQGVDPRGLRDAARQLRDTEFQTACAQVERIAYLRLKALLPD